MSAPVVQFFVAGYAAKSAIDGLKEGNLTKAVLSGISAYNAFSGLESLGTEAAKEVAKGTATDALTGELGSAASDEVVSGAITKGTTSAVEDVGGTSLSSAAEKLKTTGVEEQGFLGKVGGWAEKNPELSAGLLQIGGGALQGHAQEELLKDKWKREERLEAESRKRRGYIPSTGLLGKQQFNPSTGQWEVKS